MSKHNKSSVVKPGSYVATMPDVERGANIIKRYRVNYTTAQKVNLGMLPPSALEEEAEEKAKRRAELEAELREEIKTQAEHASESSSEEHVNHTFWEDDDGDRPLISKDEYAKFLEENHLDIGPSFANPTIPGGI